MITKQSIQILGLILMISFIFGCIGDGTNSKAYSENDLKNIKPGFGVVGDSEFETGLEWYQKSISNDSSVFMINRSSGVNSVVLMKVIQYQNISDYNGDYETLNRKTPAWNVITGTKIISILNVKTIKKSRLDGSESIMYYFFEKNGKYYQVFIDITSTKNENKNLVDKTVNTIVSTIR